MDGKNTILGLAPSPYLLSPISYLLAPPTPPTPPPLPTPSLYPRSLPPHPLTATYIPITEKCIL
jgi:hypothetical protein